MTPDKSWTRPSTQVVALALLFALVLISSFGCRRRDYEPPLLGPRDADLDVSVSDEVTGDISGVDVASDADDADDSVFDTDMEEDGFDPPPVCEALDVTVPDGATTVLLAGTVVTPMDVFEGEVLFWIGTHERPGFIICAAEDCSLEEGGDRAIRYETMGLIFPGLIDNHQHLNWNSLPRFDHGDTLYDDRYDWRNDDVDFSPDGSDRYDELYDGKPSSLRACNIIRWAEARLIISGVTSVVGSGRSDVCVDGLVRNLDSIDRLEGIDSAGLGSDFDSLYQNSAWSVPTSELTDSSWDVYNVHIAEGVNRDSWDEFVELDDSEDGVYPPLALVHGTGMTIEQFALMSTRGAKLIWSPRSNIDFYGRTADIPSARAVGLPIALAPDWTPTGSLNLFEEMSCVDRINQRYYDGQITDQELVEMVTSSAALVAGAGDRLGRLETGMIADILVLSGDPSAPYHSLVGGQVEDVEIVFIGGRPRYGRQALMTSFGTEIDLDGCDLLDTDWFYDLDGDGAADTDMCLSDRVLCLAEDDATGDVRDMTLAELHTEISSVLTRTMNNHDCSTPVGEDCYMFRLMELARCDQGPSGSECDFRRSINNRAGPIYEPTQGDQDGDGIGDDEDNCPAIFNPPLFDSAEQADADSDGTGDSCDPCTDLGALVPEFQCDLGTRYDTDGDDWPNHCDNCPGTSNPSQADQDGDEKGDVCDWCQWANPNLEACEAQ